MMADTTPVAASTSRDILDLFVSTPLTRCAPSSVSLSANENENNEITVVFEHRPANPSRRAPPGRPPYPVGTLRRLPLPCASGRTSGRLPPWIPVSVPKHTSTDSNQPLNHVSHSRLGSGGSDIPGLLTVSLKHAFFGSTEPQLTVFSRPRPGLTSRSGTLRSPADKSAPT